MLQHERFDDQEWEVAPVYAGDLKQSGVIPLDFAVLSDIAQHEENSGSFRPHGEGDLTTAPLYIGHMPSAFYKVRAERPEFMSEFEIKHSETIIVIEGVLKVVTDDAYKARDTKGDTNNFRPGQVTRIEKRHLAQDMVNLEPVGVLEPAECLALTIFDDPEIIFDGGRRSLIIRPN